MPLIEKIDTFNTKHILQLYWGRGMYGNELLNACGACCCCCCCRLPHTGCVVICGHGSGGCDAALCGRGGGAVLGRGGGTEGGSEEGSGGGRPAGRGGCWEGGGAECITRREGAV